MGRSRSQRGVVRIGQGNQDSFVGLIQGVIDYVNGNVLGGRSGWESERPAGQGVVHTVTGRAA